MSITLKVFISCVSQEFASYRADLQNFLTASGREIKIMEDFVDGPGTLLEKLDRYISGCQSVIHLIGDGTGSKAKPAEIRWLLHEKLPDFQTVMPELAPWLDPDSCPFTYTQWECFLAVYHRVPCFIYVAEAASRREPGWTSTADSKREQAAHLDRLRQLGQDRRKLPFEDAKDIAIKFLNSYFDMGGHVPASAPAPALIQWPTISQLPRHPLADREQEFEAFRALITGQSRERILLISGPSDRGKSVLVAQFYECCRACKEVQVGHTELKMAFPLEEALAGLRRDLRNVRFPRFDREWSGLRRSEMLRAAFLEDIEESSQAVVLMLDTYEQSTEDSKRWIENHLLPRCRQYDALRLIVAGQEVPKCTGVMATEAVTIELPPILDHHHWCEYNRRCVGLKSIPEDHLATLVAAAQGSPRAISNMLSNLRRLEGVA